ncbi:glycine oxidase [Chthonomonas calidirosea]|uniref:Glycine oxidase n=1 Tax=Chthonomonas calidirosea (strain DSM 23976 / ICMP 18418 / T49) TaxID=1303518 RepID=S0EUV8_CHTCT|nr:FAD-dependent oxidoreductase [Chthonomonas calidirosea]CCW35465.1 glycine oxidase [Chthonomonas calidirosea T49]CEK20196.1 glycine oxidase [Chthonomonas calidirosea]
MTQADVLPSISLEVFSHHHEVIIVGGGIIGSLIAYTLRRAGAEVIMLDAGFEGEATRASAGMLAPYPEGLAGELLEWAEESIALYPALVAELQEQTGIAVPFSLEGTGLVMPGGEDHLSVWPSLASLNLRGRSYPGGYVHPLRLKEALWQAFQRMGGLVLRAEALLVTPGRVETDRGALLGSHIVLATGAWSGRFGLGVQPVKGEAMWLETAPPTIPLFFEEGYLLPRDGGLYVGATQREGWRPGVDLIGLQWLISFVHNHVPHLETAPIGALLWGYRPMGTLQVGEIASGLYAATGHGRNGVLLAPATAQRIARSILGVSPRRSRG